MGPTKVSRYPRTSPGQPLAAFSVTRGSRVAGLWGPLALQRLERWQRNCSQIRSQQGGANLLEAKLCQKDLFVVWSCRCSGWEQESACVCVYLWPVFGHRNLAQTMTDLEIADDRSLCRDAEVQRHPLTAPVLVNPGLVSLNHMKLLICSRFWATTMATSYSST